MAGLGGFIAPTSTLAANRRTFGELVGELARPIDADDDTVRALAQDAIRAAIRKLNMMGGWPWEILDVEVTSSSGTSDYTLPDAFKMPLAMHKLDGTGGKKQERLIYVPYDTYINAYDLTQTGYAHYYTMKNLFEKGQVTLWPQPTGTFYYSVEYYRETPRPSRDSDPMEIPEYAMEAYMTEAWYEFLKRLPSERRPFDIGMARVDAQNMRARLTAFINNDGDSVRIV